jgi:hypothetical protein
MTIRPLTLAAVAATLLLGACASTRTTPSITAYTDPDFTGHTFQWVAVAVDDGDLAWRTLLETHLVAELRERGVNAQSALQLFPPTREWSVQQKRSELIRRGFDGIVRLERARAWKTEDHVPQTTTTKVTRETKEEKTEEEGKKEGKGKEEETVTTTTDGGYTVTTEWAGYEVKVVEVLSDRVAWIGAATVTATGSNAGRFTDDIVDRLQFDRMVAGTSE